MPLNLNLEFEVQKDINVTDLYFPYTLIIKMKFKSKGARGIALNKLEKSLRELEGNYHRS